MVLKTCRDPSEYYDNQRFVRDGEVIKMHSDQSLCLVVSGGIILETAYCRGVDGQKWTEVLRGSGRDIMSWQSRLTKEPFVVVSIGAVVGITGMYVWRAQGKGVLDEEQVALIAV